jgi:Domain of unknown function (DUF4158)
VGYPSEPEGRRLERFPDRIAVEDLRECFALSDRDPELVFAQRGPENRLGLALTLCAIRFLGFVPDDLASVPEEALCFVAAQVDAAAQELLQYGARAQTRRTHLTVALSHLGWRRVEPSAPASGSCSGRWRATGVWSSSARWRSRSACCPRLAGGRWRPWGGG